MNKKITLLLRPKYCFFAIFILGRILPISCGLFNQLISNLSSIILEYTGSMLGRSSQQVTSIARLKVDSQCIECNPDKIENGRQIKK